MKLATLSRAKNDPEAASARQRMTLVVKGCGNGNGNGAQTQTEPGGKRPSSWSKNRPSALAEARHLAVAGVDHFLLQQLSQPTEENAVVQPVHQAVGRELRAWGKDPKALLRTSPSPPPSEDGLAGRWGVHASLSPMRPLSQEARSSFIGTRLASWRHGSHW